MLIATLVIGAFLILIAAAATRYGAYWTSSEDQDQRFEAECVAKSGHVVVMIEKRPRRTCFSG